MRRGVPLGHAAIAEGGSLKMKYRSWLVVPGSSEKRLGLAMGTGADVVVVDLADTVPDAARREARAMACEWLSVHRRNLLEHRRMGRWVRINALDSGLSRDDLLAIMPGAPDGIILPGATGPDAVRQLASEIYELEQANGIAANSVQIMPVAGDSPRGLFGMGQYLDAPHQRLFGLTWNAGGLGVAMGCRHLHGDEGRWSDAARLVRAQTVLTAHASRTVAVDAPYERFEDERGLAAAARQARAEGFAGMFAIHPGQVATINAAFTPSGEELSRAREILALFSANPDQASLPFQGCMIDRTHLAIARQLIDAADESDAGCEGQRLSALLRPA
ncbi:citrate lyase subunit beta / citryl-CoA lyase [Novosphingobium mathurense]|uniref:Citrate lyase subunit beta / citryl-CoA lyase n=2 Tax=Novosphingobium mathurense TaxID=428990 RepID=A0A1U6HK53_9SPHN|nr:citrate lyase subunit beta / citryl-CoA lyase [Novosphingobium mathurense]